MTNEELDNFLRLLDGRLKAVARSVTHLADGLSQAETSRRRDHEELRGGVIEVIAVTSDIRLKSDPAQLTAAEIADRVPHAVLCEARSIQFMRGGAVNMEPLPLPPPPGAGTGSIPVLAPQEDDSISFQTHKDGARLKGSIKVATLAGWLIATVSVGVHVYNLIKSALH